MDLFSAGAILELYTGLSLDNKVKFEAMSIGRMQEIALRIAKKRDRVVRALRIIR